MREGGDGGATNCHPRKPRPGRPSRPLSPDPRRHQAVRSAPTRPAGGFRAAPGDATAAPLLIRDLYRLMPADKGAVVTFVWQGGDHVAILCRLFDALASEAKGRVMMHVGGAKPVPAARAREVSP